MTRNRPHSSLGIKEEEALFYEIQNRIKGGIREFQRPEFNRVHLVWIDPFVTKNVRMNHLKRLFANKNFNKGHPVFVSLCLSYGETRQFIEDNNFTNAVRILSSELLTPYDPNFNLSFQLRLYTDAFFEKGQKVFFYTPTKRPDNIMGNFAKVLTISNSVK